MYPVRLGFGVAVQRVNALVANGHNAESLVTAIFTIEKTMRRTLRQIVVSAGFTSKTADKIVRRLNGLHALNTAWELYDPKNRKLTEIVAPADWKVVADSAEIRNNMVHGTRVYSQAYYQAQTVAVMAALNNIKQAFDGEYGFSGWTTFDKRLVSRLHGDPKVTWK